MFLRKGDAGITPNRWLTVEASSRMMAPSPKQRLRVRTPSAFLTPISSRNSLSVGRNPSVISLSPFGARISTSCMTPTPVYQIPCRSYFQGGCDNDTCLDSHDPSQVAKCKMYMNKNMCTRGDQCEFRHDRSNHLDRRPRFDIEMYRKKEMEKANEIRKQIEKEQQENREKKKETYKRTVYHEPASVRSEQGLTEFDDAMQYMRTLKASFHTPEKQVTIASPAVCINVIEASPMVGIKGVQQLDLMDDSMMSETDFEGYFDEMLEWLANCNITKWSPKQVYEFYTEARLQETIYSSNAMFLMNTIFTIYQPSHTAWAEFIHLMTLDAGQTTKLMNEWLQYDDITELHIGGLYAGLMQMKSSKWTVDRVSKLLIQTINSQRPDMGLACSNLSSVFPDGCFILGMTKYLDLDTVAKITKCYLKSKEQKYEIECTCYTFECTCPSFVEWDLYGVHTFRPIFDYSEWNLDQKAEFFGKSSKKIWVDLEISAILDQIFGVDEEAKSKVISVCEPKEADERILKHLAVNTDDMALQEIADISMHSADDEVLTDADDDRIAKPMVITSVYAVCKNIKTDMDGGLPEQCTNASALSCRYNMCGECCHKVENRKCTAHVRLNTMGSFSEMDLNEFNKLICTAEDEHWDFVTFGGIKPMMTFDSIEQFDKYIINSEAKETVLRTVIFTSGIGLKDHHINKISSTYGQTLEVLEIQSINPGDKFNISDDIATHLLTMPNLVKLRLVACTKISDKAVVQIFQKCAKLQSVEISGAARFSGFLTDKCLKPLFEDYLPDLHLLNLLDQYFIHTNVIERLRRKRKGLKIIIGERDDGEEDQTSSLLFRGGCSSPYTTPHSFRE